MDGQPGGWNAAIGAVLGVDMPATDHLDRSREALATRGLGLIPVRDPQMFGWPGRWIAVTDRGRAVVMYGVPSGPLNDDALGDDEHIERGYVVAPHDLDLAWSRRRTAGTVEAIVLAPETAGPARLAATAAAEAGCGLLGDRYGDGGGTFAAPGRTGTDLTLIEAESLDAAGVTPVDARRNVVTRGIDLDALLGRRFRIGAVECLGQRRAEPCAHLERLAGAGMMRALVHRGGLRADILSSGSIAVGDPVAIVAS